MTFLKTHLARIWSSYTSTWAVFWRQTEHIVWFLWDVRCLTILTLSTAPRATSLVLNRGNGGWLLSWQNRQSNKDTRTLSKPRAQVGQTFNTEARVQEYWCISEHNKRQVLLFETVLKKKAAVLKHKTFFYLFYAFQFQIFFLFFTVERVLSGIINFQKCSNALSRGAFKFQRQPDPF